MQSNRKPRTEQCEKTDEAQAKEDLAFIEELERQQLACGLKVKEDLTLQKRIIFKWITGKQPYIDTAICCVASVCFNEPFEKAAVNLRRMQAHCEIHKKWFHEESPLSRGCVTCHRYHPSKHPLNRR
jgi:hypothetical protein